jgi:hypothetical protein
MKNIKNFILSTMIATAAISTTAIAEDFQVYAEIGPSISKFQSPILDNLRPDISVGGAYKIDSMFSAGLRIGVQGKNYLATVPDTDIFTTAQAEVFAQVYSEDALSIKLGVASGLKIKNTDLTGYEFINSFIARVEYALEDDCAFSTAVRTSILDTKWKEPQISIIFGISYDL